MHKVQYITCKDTNDRDAKMDWKMERVSDEHLYSRLCNYALLCIY